MDYIVMIVIVAVVAVLILSSYSRGKHTPKEVKPRDKAKQDEDHKCFEVRSTEGQLNDYIEEYRKQGWTLETKEVKPNTSMFGSDIWIVTFHRQTAAERQALEDEARRASGYAAPLPAEQIPRPAESAEDPFGMAPAQEPAPEEDPFGMTPAAPAADTEDPFGMGTGPMDNADEDPFANEPLKQLPAQVPKATEQSEDESGTDDPSSKG